MCGSPRPISALYVDDEEFLLDICREFLGRTADISVDTAISVEDGLHALKNRTYDAIISDYEMPVQTGIDFLRILRSRGDRTPFLIFSGRGREEIVIEAFDTGADFYVQKGGEPKSQFADLAHKVKTAVRRRQNERELENTNSLLRATLEATADGILVIGADGRVTACNSKFLHMWQLDGQRALPATEKEVLDAIVPRAADPGAILEPFVKARTSSRQTSYDIIRCKDGRVFRQFSQAQTIGETVVGRVWSFRDITGQSRTERELHAASSQPMTAETERNPVYPEHETTGLHPDQSAQKYRAIFHAQTHPLLLVDRKTLALLDLNHAACALYGYGEDEIQDLTLYRLSAETVEATGETIGPLPDIRTVFHRRRNGTIFPAEVSAAPVRIGSHDAVVIAVRDSTRSKQIEDALRHSNVKLNLLLGVTRHDILNRLTALSGYTEILAGHITDPRLRDLLDRQQQATESIRRQIDFTREYDELGTRSPRWFRIDAISKRAYAQILQTITFTCETGNLEVYADPMIEKVFYNLFDNAFRYGDGISRICISWEIEGEDLLLCFRDNGIGIPEEEKENIFHRGYGKNTGLGLYLTREILSITGMTIRECGEYRCGARFEIRVPEGNYRFLKPMTESQDCSNREPILVTEQED